jgi:16S rRNA (guanine527-N7)-methyltransferase
VVAIMRPDLQVTLLEAREKKAGFLRQVAEELHLDVDVLRGRAEDLGRTSEHGAQYDLATARAVAPMERLLPWAIPFLRPGGMLYAVKGERWQEELDEAAPVLRRLGARVAATPVEIGPVAPEAPRTVIVVRDPR